MVGIGYDKLKFPLGGGEWFYDPIVIIFEHMYLRKKRKIEIMKEKYKKWDKNGFFTSWIGEIVVEFTI